jgi:hypothetical protein
VADFVRAVVSFGWGEETLDVIPPLPLPSARYYPASRLFGAAPSPNP